MLRKFARGKIGMLLFLHIVISSAGCLKRVTIPVNKGHPVQNKVYYVYLKSGREYLGKWYPELLNPKFEDDYLSGMLDGEDQRVYIALDDIKTIEAIQQDKRKIVRGTVIGVAAFLALGILASQIDFEKFAED